MVSLEAGPAHDESQKPSKELEIDSIKGKEPMKALVRLRITAGVQTERQI